MFNVAAVVMVVVVPVDTGVIIVSVFAGIQLSL